jgi:peptidyl-prolyl cis-trans isomerase SurA
MKINALLMVLLFAMATLQAQEKKPIVDEVVAIVGNKAILKSDVENQYIQYRSQNPTVDPNVDMRCMILDNLMLSKLLITQAQLDSVDISDAQVEERIERNMRYFISQFGSKQKLEEFYKKSIKDIKDELRESVRDQLYVEFMQDKLTRGVTITPTEIKLYFKKIPEDSLPMFPSEYELIEIAKIPKVSQTQSDVARYKLNELRDRILAGESFATMAVMYSEDPGSALKGGELGFVNRGELYPEFETAAFALKPGEVSPIIKTKAGFHIIQLIERRGQTINVRHILVMLKPAMEDMAVAKTSLDSVYTLIKSGSLTIPDAVTKYSESPTKKSGGFMVNPYSGGLSFDENSLDESMSSSVLNMNIGDYSMPILSKTEEGEPCYKIVVLKKKTLAHKANLIEDYDKIQKAALEDKKQRILDKWVTDKIKDIYVNILTEYKKCSFTHPWIKD